MDRQPIILSIIYSVFFVLLLSFNLGLSYFLRKSNLSIIENIYPFNLPVTPTVLWLVLILITIAIFQFNFYSFSPVPTTLLLAGAWSNFVERLFFGEVADYLYLGPVYANLADIMIWIGIALINLKLWGVLKR
jgi:lipoprotein signal peptidase